MNGKRSQLAALSIFGKGCAVFFFVEMLPHQKQGLLKKPGYLFGNGKIKNLQFTDNQKLKRNYCINNHFGATLVLRGLRQNHPS